MSSVTPYSVRWQGPSVIPHSRAWDVSVEVEHGNASPTISAGTFTLYTPDGTARVDAEAATISGGTLSYSLADSVLAGTDVGPRWLVKFEATIGGSILPFYNDVVVCLAPLYPPVGVSDLLSAYSKLGDLQSTASDLQTHITDAWTALTQRLYSDAVPFWKMRTPGALRPWLMAKALEGALDDLALLLGEDSHYAAEARRHEAALDRHYKSLRSLMDETENNTPSSTHEAASPTVTLSSSPRHRSRWRR